MIFQCGDMWSAYDDADLFCITTNSYIKFDGKLVMGRGIARQVRDRWKGMEDPARSAWRKFDWHAGQEVQRTCGHLGTYGLLVSEYWPRAKIGLFQVKLNYSDKANLTLIENSAKILSDWCLAHPRAKVHLNFPGVGNGQLSISEVWPIITPHLNQALFELPSDAVTIWVLQEKEWNEIGNMKLSDPTFFKDEDSYVGYKETITHFGWPAPN